MIISVASGKGGTGKTMVATSLALSLKNDNNDTLLDCGVEEPNAHVFLKPSIAYSEPVNIMVPEVVKDECTYCGMYAQVCTYHAIAVVSNYVLTFPQLCHGCGTCSYLCPEKAITEEPREMAVVESRLSDEVGFVHGILTSARRWHHQ